MSIGRIATAAIAGALLAGCASGWGMAIWTPKAICEANGGMYGGDDNRYHEGG